MQSKWRRVATYTLLQIDLMSATTATRVIELATFAARQRRRSFAHRLGDNEGLLRDFEGNDCVMTPCQVVLVLAAHNGRGIVTTGGNT